MIEISKQNFYGSPKSESGMQNMQEDLLAVQKDVHTALGTLADHERYVRNIKYAIVMLAVTQLIHIVWNWVK